MLRRVFGLFNSSQTQDSLAITEEDSGYIGKFLLSCQMAREAGPSCLSLQERQSLTFVG
jgi:hypothetical protein